MATEPFETAESSGYPTVTQISVFLENRMGQLLRLTRVFDDTDVRILGMSVDDSFEYAVARLLMDDPELATEVLQRGGFALTQREVLAVVVPSGKRGLLAICAALLGAEVNVHYAYTLLQTATGRPAIVLAVDNEEMAVKTLLSKHFEVLDQGDLKGLR
jgi:hypothetical protein